MQIRPDTPPHGDQLDEGIRRICPRERGTTGVIHRMTVSPGAPAWAGTIVATAAKRIDHLFAWGDAAEVELTADPVPWHLCISWGNGVLRPVVADALGLIQTDPEHYTWALDGGSLPVWLHRGLRYGLMLGYIDQVGAGHVTVSWTHMRDHVRPEDVPEALQLAWHEQDQRDPIHPPGRGPVLDQSLEEFQAAYVRAHHDEVHARLAVS